jgi:hypothetical protein
MQHRAQLQPPLCHSSQLTGSSSAHLVGAFASPYLLPLLAFRMFLQKLQEREAQWRAEEARLVERTQSQTANNDRLFTSASVVACY